MHGKFMLLLASSLFIISGIARAEVPDVVVSIKPIHSLVASIMKGVSEPGLIVEGAASPHTFSMKPSIASALEKADIVFWVGHGLEAFLEKPLEALSSKAKVVELDGSSGLELLKFREGGAFEPHDDGDAHEDHAGHEAGQSDHGHEDHGHEENDMHLWLDPDNAKAMAKQIETTLVGADPDNASLYTANTADLMARLDALDTEIAATVAPLRDRPFIVFHDAYQYFENHYGVRAAGSITVSPETLPGAARIADIHKKVEELGATCVFAEPQFEPKLVQVVLEGTPAKAGVLDPEAATLAPGPDLYFQLMRGIAGSLKDCLAGGS